MFKDESLLYLFMALPNMYFVYSLSFEGDVFYIGKCKDLAARYAAHMGTSKYPEGYPTGAKIATIIKSGGCPEIRIIDYLEAEQAIKRENELISLFFKAGQSLTNVNGKPWRGLFDIERFDFHRTPKNMKKFARYKQGIAEYYKLFWDDNSNADKIEFPKAPFNEK